MIFSQPNNPAQFRATISRAWSYSQDSQVSLIFQDGRTRCDCFLLDVDAATPTQPPALIQLVSRPRIKHRGLPTWKDGDILKLEPTISCGWNDVQETGRCLVDLAITLTCEGREGFLMGMIPMNPDPYDFTQDAAALDQ